MKFFTRYTPLQIAIHIYAWSALVWIIIQMLTGTFSINPIQELEQRTGRHAITLREPLKSRRTLGLYAFMYATIHVIIFVDLDYGLAWSQIAQTILQKPYIIVGVITFIMLIPLAFTSFDIWKKRLGKKWKRLHQMVYLIAPLAVLHYAWSKKGDIFTLSGDVIRPLIYGIVIVVFLILRIPAVRHGIASLPTRGLGLSPKQESQPKADAS
jgi:methionine sulfoxide reductase heme-binding subunit